MLHCRTSDNRGAYIIIFASGLHQCSLNADVHYMNFRSQCDTTLGLILLIRSLVCSPLPPKAHLQRKRHWPCSSHSLSLWHVAPKNFLIFTPLELFKILAMPYPHSCMHLKLGVHSTVSFAPYSTTFSLWSCP